LKGVPAPLRIGTRGSALALWQTERIRSQLASAGRETERVEIKTTGDLAPEVPFATLGTRALFTKQIDDALLEHRIDLAVHSLKDLPTRLPSGIVIGAVGNRDDPRDALVGHGSLSWGELPDGALVATSSLRRRAQLLHQRPDLHVVDLRGNVDTRLVKLDSHPQWTAIVLATAGLVRLGLEHRISERLDPDLMLPAPGQGALAVTVRSGDVSIAALVREALHDPPTELQVSAERAFLHALGGGCQVPVAAYADLRTGARTVLHLHGRVVSHDGREQIEGHQVGPVLVEQDAAALGALLAERLLKEGAREILAASRTGPAPVVGEP
jgi:hydroxymethylbilane synthase